MTRKWTLLAIAALVCAPALADPLKKGEKEVDFTFSYDNLDPDGEGSDELKTTIITGSFGWMLTDTQEVGGFLAYNKLDAGDAGDTDSTQLGAFYHFNFRAGTNMNPYIGARISTISGDLGDIYDTSYGFVGGIKVWPWANAGFNFGVAWDELMGSDDFEDATDLSMFAGIGIKF